MNKRDPQKDQEGNDYDSELDPGNTGAAGTLGTGQDDDG